MKHTKMFEDFINECECGGNCSCESSKKQPIVEANAAGTISDDEDERREELLKRVKEQMQELLASAELDAKDIGGSFRSPGIMADIKKELNNQLKKFR
jgi:hypothetical protein